MYCPACGTFAEGSAHFCTACGKEFATAGAAEASGPTASAGSAPASGTTGAATQVADVAARASAVAGDYARVAQDYIQAEQTRQTWWMPSLLGGCAAALAGVAAMWLLREGALAAGAAWLDNAANLQGLGSYAINMIRGLLPGPWTLLLTAQGATTTLTIDGELGASAFTGTGSVLFAATPALSLFALVPFAAMFLGGWGAVRYSRTADPFDAVVRAVMSLVPYALVLTVAAIFFRPSLSTSGSIPLGLLSVDASVSAKQGVGLVSVVLTTLLFGLPCAAIGGLVAVRSGSIADGFAHVWQRLGLPYFRETVEAARAVGIGLVASAVLCFGAAMYLLQTDAVRQVSAELPVARIVLGGTLMAIPQLAAALMTYASGGMFSVASQTSGIPVEAGNTPNFVFSASVWTDAFAPGLHGVPAALFVGMVGLLVWAGYRSVRAAGTQDPMTATIAGASVAVPFTAFVTVLAFAATTSTKLSVSAVGQNASIRGLLGFNVFVTALIVLAVSLVSCGVGGLLAARRRSADAGPPQERS